VDHIKVKIIEAALKVKIENEDLFDGYQVIIFFEQSTYILKHLLQLGKFRRAVG
jgi:hypothetical protein